MSVRSDAAPVKTPTLRGVPKLVIVARYTLELRGAIGRSQPDEEQLGGAAHRAGCGLGELGIGLKVSRADSFFAKAAPARFGPFANSRPGRPRADRGRERSIRREQFGKRFEVTRIEAARVLGDEGEDLEVILRVEFMVVSSSHDRPNGRVDVKRVRLPDQRGESTAKAHPAFV